MDAISTIYYWFVVITICFIIAVIPPIGLFLTNYFWTLLKLNMHLGNELTHRND